MEEQTHAPAQDMNPNGSGEMFDGIAKRYDLLNRVMSMGQDRRWRRRLVARVLGSVGDQGRVLDLATGTGDVAIAIARRHPSVSVTGLDPSLGMLDVGRKKIAELEGDLPDRIDLVEGSAESLPFADQRFDSCSIAFGIRNVPDREAGLREMVRVTKPGGVIAVLELSEPTAALPRFYVHHCVPMLGRLLSSGAEYRYLQSSIEGFPPAPEFAELMRACGVNNVAVEAMSFGGVHLYSGHA